MITNISMSSWCHMPYSIKEQYRILLFSKPNNFDFVFWRKTSNSDSIYRFFKCFAIFAIVKQKTSSVLLLFSFFGLLIHDLMPHHHHEDRVNGVHFIYYHIQTYCDSEEEHLPSDIQCDFEENRISDIHHECPHHFHNCIIKDFQINPSNRSELPSSRNRISESGLCRSINFLQTYQFCINVANSDRVFHILKLGIQGPVSPRGPPSVA